MKLITYIFLAQTIYSTVVFIRWLDPGSRNFFILTLSYKTVTSVKELATETCFGFQN